MMFDAEIWHIAKDEAQRIYCDVVNNRVDVIPARGRSHAVYIKVPSDLFHFLRNVGGLTIEVLRANPVSFYLEEAVGVWYFGMEVPDGESIDLWAYKELPGWAYRL